jgi:Protein of unknown function (DUF1822)
MSYPDDATTFSVALTLAAHAQAQRFSQQHTNPAKARQVYLNTLAVHTVSFYLDCLGIDTDLPQSQSWNPIQQALLDTAALQVKQRGLLECRPVLSGSTTVYVPAETHQDRIGYVAIQLDSNLKEATLLGFLPAATAEQVPLEQLHPLEKLADYLEECAAAAPVEAKSAIGSNSPSSAPNEAQPAQVTTPLSLWLQDLAIPGWQTVKNAFVVQQPSLGFRGEQPPTLDTPPVEQRRKQVSLLGISPAIQLTVGLSPLPNNEMEIWAQISSADEQQALPPHLRLCVLDTVGTEVMQAEARNTEAIRLRFTGSVGERFSLKLTLGSASVTEFFVI